MQNPIRQPAPEDVESDVVALEVATARGDLLGDLSDEELGTIAGGPFIVNH